MTNREILQGKFLFNLPEAAFNSTLVYNGLDPLGTYTSADEKAMDISFAGLIFTASTAPKSIREGDYQITSHDLKDMLLIRSALLRKWGIKDDTIVKPTITGRSPW